MSHSCWFQRVWENCRDGTSYSLARESNVAIISGLTRGAKRIEKSEWEMYATAMLRGRYVISREMGKYLSGDTCLSSIKRNFAGKFSFPLCTGDERADR